MINDMGRKIPLTPMGVLAPGSAHAISLSGIYLILISYLTDRKMVLKFRGVLSALRSLPGFSPQRTVLGVLLFIILFNGAALRPSIPRPSWPLFPRMSNDPEALKVKFIDDLSIAAKVKLSDLVSHDRP